jgi:3-hydroxyisobutyrate dehydrogenase-like beta-hydroxyacid dehydrogenase
MASTVDPTYAADLGRRLAAVGLRGLDAPVSGGPTKARDGTMSMMIGGPAALVEGLGDLLAAMAGRVFHVGETVGDGSKVKIVNNMIAAINLAAAAEGMALAERMGLDPATIYEVVQASSGASFVFGTRMERVVKGDPSVHAAAHILAKDVGIARAAAAAAGSPAPLADLTAEVFRATLAMGLGARDDGAIIEYFRRGRPGPA